MRAFCCAWVYRNVSLRAQWGEATTKSSGSLQIKAQSTNKAAHPAGQRGPQSAAIAGFTGGGGGGMGLAGWHGMHIGRLMFELWLYDPSPEWPGHRVIRLSREMHTYVCVHIFLSIAWLIGQSGEVKVRNANFLGIWDKAGVQVC